MCQRRAGRVPIAGQILVTNVAALAGLYGLNRLAEVVGMGALIECGYTVGMMARPTEMTIEFAK